jgi:hypothetical protein
MGLAGEATWVFAITSVFFPVIPGVKRRPEAANPTRDCRED